MAIFNNNFAGGTDVLGIFLLLWGMYGVGETLNLNMYFSQDLLTRYFKQSGGDLVINSTTSDDLQYQVPKFENKKPGEYPYLSNTSSEFGQGDCLTGMCLLGKSSGGLKAFGHVVKVDSGYKFYPNFLFIDGADPNFWSPDMMRLIGLSLIDGYWESYDVIVVWQGNVAYYDNLGRKCGSYYKGQFIACYKPDK